MDGFGLFKPDPDPKHCIVMRIWFQVRVKLRLDPAFGSGSRSKGKKLNIQKYFWKFLTICCSSSSGFISLPGFISGFLPHGSGSATSVRIRIPEVSPETLPHCVWMVLLLLMQMFCQAERMVRSTALASAPRPEMCPSPARAWAPLSSSMHSWARDNVTMFQATMLFVFALLVMTIFVVASPFRHQDLNILRNFSSPISSFKFLRGSRIVACPLSIRHSVQLNSLKFTAKGIQTFC